MSINDSGFTFFVKREVDFNEANYSNYTKEVAEYNEDLRLVYDNSAYKYTIIQYKDTHYLVPTLGGVYSALKLVMVPFMICMRKQFRNQILKTTARFLGSGD